MKSLLVISLLLSAPLAFSCTMPSIKKLNSILHVGKSPSRWRTVRGKTYEANKTYPALVTVLRRIEKSYVEYKGDVYRFDEQDVQVCDRKKANEFKAIHPEATARISRTGQGKEAMLTVRSGIFTFRLRPAQLVKNAIPSLDLYDEYEDLDFFESILVPAID